MAAIRPLLVLLFLATLGPGSPANAQNAAPQLSRAQRDALRAVVTAVDQATDVTPTPDGDWPIHLLRASDGSHYIAFSALVPPEFGAAGGDGTVYVRLATRPEERAAAATPERSAVMEWLLGQRSDPLPARPTRVVSVPTGELPVGVSDRTGSGQNSSALRLIEHERERARERREDAERARRADLESDAASTRRMYPFEDFDVRARLGARGSRAAITRAVTAGPGGFDLFVGWLPEGAPARPEHVRVLRRLLVLPSAQAGALSLSSIIVADAVRALAVASTAEAQSAHPYAIGAMEIEPRLAPVFTGDDRLTVVFQVINPQGTAAGKPDVTVGFRIVQPTAGGETLVATLNPQHYHAEVLPPDFDLSRGHPIIVAMTAPLESLPRGAYRLLVGVTDRIAGRSTSGRLDFRIAPSPRGLLREAPGPALPRPDRAVLLSDDRLAPLVALLRSAASSPAMTTALDAAAARAFIDLLREEPVPAAETGTRTTLRALALLALGDTPAAIAAQAEQALRQGAPPGAARLLVGAARALEGQDRAAAAAWESAIADGYPARPLAPLILQAYLRAGDGPRAWNAAASFPDESDEATARLRAHAALMASAPDAALSVLEEYGSDAAASAPVRLLRLQALFAGFVAGAGAGATEAGRTRFETLASAYVAGEAPHAELVAEWRALMAR